MLVRLEEVAQVPSSPLLAQVRTEHGGATVRWCGAPDAAPGAYFVEWDVDEALGWGENARAAAAQGPLIRLDGHCVVLRGRLADQGDGVAVLTLGETPVLLELAAPLPGGVDGSWVELRVARERLSLHPYAL